MTTISPISVRRSPGGKAARPRQRSSAVCAAKRGRKVSVRQDGQEWTTLETAADHISASEALRMHDAWLGPTKLVHGPEGVRERIEFSLPADESSDLNCLSLLDQWEALPQKALRRAIFRTAREMLANRANVNLRNRIPVAAIRAWVQSEGYLTATDEQGDLRLAITYGGFDGQTRINCGPERLRMSMTLGNWTDLPAVVEAAMWRLAAEANACTRLVRIAWLGDGGQRRCEGQVDLTGVPWVGDDNPCFEPTARHMLQMALAGLEAAARRLGRELTALADPANYELAEALNERAARAAWWKSD